MTIEFIWMDGQYVSEIRIPPLPGTMIPDFRAGLAIGPTAWHMTQHISGMERANISELSYPEESFDFIVAGDFCEVPHTYAQSSLAPGSAPEVAYAVARLLAPGGLAFLHVWHPVVYAGIHHAQVLGHLSDVLRTPKALADMVSVAVTAGGPVKRSRARRQFESLLPERIEKLAWHPLPGPLTAFLPNRIRELLMRYAPHQIFPGALMVVRKRWPRLDSRGEWS